MRLARSEIAERRFALTRQYLAVHEPELDPQGEARVDRIDGERESGAYFLYVALRDVPYHLVVIVRPNEGAELAVSWLYIQANVSVYLALYSAETTPAYVTEHLGLVPTYSHERGERFRPPRRGDGTYREHAWKFEPLRGVPGDVEEKLGGLLDAIEAVKERVAALAATCEVHVVVVYEAWAGNPQFGGFFFEADIMRRIAALGAAVDFDLYAWGPQMAEDAPEEP